MAEKAEEGHGQREPAEGDEKELTTQQRAWLAELSRIRAEEERKRRREQQEKEKQRKEAEQREQLIEAAFDGDLDTMKAILDEGPATGDSEDAHANSALSEASAGGSMGAVSLLLARGADPNKRGEFSRTPLWRACFAGNEEVVEALLEGGADPSLASDTGETCDMAAATRAVRELVQSWDSSKATVPSRSERRSSSHHAYPSSSSSSSSEVLIRGRRARKLHLRKMEDFLVKDCDGALAHDGRWPLLIDPSQQGSVFARYTDSNYVNVLSTRHVEREKLRKSILGAVRFGKPVVFDLLDAESGRMLENLEWALEQVKPGLFNDLISKRLLQEERYLDLIEEGDGEDYDPLHFVEERVRDFLVFVITQQEEPAERLLDTFFPVLILNRT